MKKLALILTIFSLCVSLFACAYDIDDFENLLNDTSLLVNNLFSEDPTVDTENISNFDESLIASLETNNEEISEYEESVVINEESKEISNENPKDETTSTPNEESKEEPKEEPKDESIEESIEDPEEEWVWIPQSGSKYHSNKNCSNMKNPNKVTKEYAKEHGYEPCKKCY